jgi:Region found in RelA / SpoT proteins
MTLHRINYVFFLQGAKRRRQLHDILGLRVIVSERDIRADKKSNGMEASNATHTYADTDKETELQGKQPKLEGVAGPGKGSPDMMPEMAVWRVQKIIRDVIAAQAVSSSSDAAATATASENGGSSSDEASTDISDSSSSSSSNSIGEWEEVQSRFKDYVTHPKPSGYQSLHMTLVHRPSGVEMEIQIRSKRMHAEAEYGAAAHSKYKALVLPPASASSGGSDSTASTNGDRTDL